YGRVNGIRDCASKDQLTPIRRFPCQCKMLFAELAPAFHVIGRKLINEEIVHSHTSELQFCVQENRPNSIADEVAGVLSEGRAAHRHHRIRKIPMIPEITEVTANFELSALRQPDALRQAEVPLLKARSSKCI